MKFSCLQENLYRGLQIVRSSIGKEQSLPILSHILLKADQGGLTLTATNLEIAVHTVIRGKVEESGSIAVDAKILCEYVGLLPKEKVDLMCSSEGVVSVSCGGFATKIRGSSPDDFPLIPHVERHEPVTFSLADMKDALSATLFTVAPQESRPELSGILFHLSEEQKSLTIVGTDAYRLSEKVIPLSGTPQPDTNVIIPIKTLQELIRITQFGMGGHGELVITDNQLLFLCDGVELYSKRIQGTYPEYMNIIPTTFTTTAHIPRSEFIQAVKAASIFSKAGLGDVQLTFTPKTDSRGTLSLYSSNASVGENTTSLDIQVQGKENSILLNYKYLLDGLTTMNAETIVFQAVDSVNPCVIKPVDGVGTLYLIMPIRQ